MTFNPSYLNRSRHGIYYIRYPLPPELHPQGKRDHIRISLQTPNKREALAYVDMMRYSGGLIIEKLQGTGMDYIDIKNALAKYFKESLVKRKDKLNRLGCLME
ncbi:MAG: hypothetical protein ACI9TY_000643 [Alphaproteobacteria bacterium]|jgi:hypothetical protein